MMPDLSVVIVSWNVRHLLRRCLLSIAQATDRLATEIVVVDNASHDDSSAMVSREFPQITLLANSTNIGFTRANNQALARCHGRYILLLNPDTEAQPGAIAALVAYMDGHRDVGIAGPQLVYSDGSVQSSRRRFPTLRTFFIESTILQRVFRGSALVRRYHMEDAPATDIQDVDWLVGACLLVRREAIDAAGMLDERFFMYCEELDWCLRIKRCGWRIVYVPEARVVHHEARSSEQVKAQQHIHFHSSRIAYVHKHMGAVQAEVLRLYLLATFLTQMLVEGAKWLLWHKRPLRAQRVGVYAAVLQSQLKPGVGRAKAESRSPHGR